MNKTDFENTYFEEAIEYSSRYQGMIDFSGYVNTNEAPSKTDKLILQQNNTLIALLSSLHSRITKLETEVLKISDSLSGQETFSWKEALDKINSDLAKVSSGHAVRPTAKKPTQFLTYKNE